MMFGDSSAVKVEEDAYVLGGYWRTVLPTNGIIKFNSVSFEWELLTIEGIPVGGRYWYYRAPSAVYVERLNRIYFFGGQIND